MHCTQLKILHKMVSILFLYGENVIVAMVTIDGGNQPFQRDTVWGGRPQKMVTTDGLQKGLKTVLEERGVNVKKMHKDDMIKTLSEMRDFKFQKSKVEAVILKRGHRVMFILKFQLTPLNMCGAMQNNTLEPIVIILSRDLSKSQLCTWLMLK